MSKKTKWVNLVKGTMINKRVTRLKSTKEVLIGVVDFADYTYLAYSPCLDQCGIYLASELEVQQEVDFDLQRFDHTKYLGSEYEVVNRDGEVINKTDMLIAEDKICYKFLDKLYVVYINGRQNIQEEHFSDLLLRKEV